MAIGHAAIIFNIVFVSSSPQRLQILASGRTRPRPDPTVDRASRRAAALARLKQRTVGSRGPAGSSNAADSARPSRSPFRPLSDNVPEASGGHHARHHLPHSSNAAPTHSTRMATLLSHDTATTVPS